MFTKKNATPAFLLLASAALLPCTSFAQDPKTSRPAISDPQSTGTRDAGSQNTGAQSSDTQSSGSAKVSDQAFVKEAAQGGMAEVELGQLAQEKASSPDVKQFGERMVTDHQKANEQLKQIASQKGMQLPAEPSAKDKATKEKLSKLSGEQFDKAYMADMVKDHKKDVAAFKRESNAGQDPAIKEFASQTLPTLEDHLKQAETIAPKTKESNKATSNSSNSSSSSNSPQH